MKMKKRISIFCMVAMVLCSVLSFGTKSQASIGLNAVSVTQPVYGIIAANTSLYSKPDTSSTKVPNLTITKGSYIMIVGYDNGFYRVQYTTEGQGYAYVPASNITTYVSTCPGKVLANTQTDPLNVRNGAGTNNPVVGRMPRGSYAPAVTSQNMNGFYNVIWGTLYGFVSSDYGYYVAY